MGGGLLIPWLTGLAIDRAIPDRDERLLAILAGLVLAAGVVRAALMAARRFIAGRQSLGDQYDMRHALYAHLLRH